mmetsp:Transcript_6820/g.9928  ORF Transcript_6820/g.9928 Transcript_6820/m.9928 type:complete len:275 (+) Transcript_6820:112-936(+)
MIWRYMFPKEGGGSMRRIIQLNRDMVARRLDEFKLTQAPTEKLKPLALFDFSRHDDAIDAMNTDISGRKGGWRFSDDETIGGFSASKLTFHPANRSDLHMEQTCQHPIVNSDLIPFLRFEGITDTTIPKGKNIMRSGFCALRSPDFILGGANIGEYYNALEIKCRLDSRIYTVNLKVRTFFPDDLYQAFITKPPKEQQNNDDDKEWNTLILPFNEFALTAFGRIREVQRKLDGGVTIEHFGITLADGKDGEFRLDLASVNCINYYPEKSYWKAT